MSINADSLAKEFQSHNGLILILQPVGTVEPSVPVFQSHNGLILIKGTVSPCLYCCIFQSHNGLILISYQN